MKKSLLMFVMFMLVSVASFAQHKVTAKGFEAYVKTEEGYELVTSESRNFVYYVTSEKVVEISNGRRYEYEVLDIHRGDDGSTHVAIDSEGGSYSKEFWFDYYDDEFAYWDGSNGILIKLTSVVITRETEPARPAQSGNWKTL